MKRILGLDLGTNSIGWALVEEAQNENNKSKIIKLGVRVNPLTADEKSDFESGKPLSTNANRTLRRGARRTLQRYKLRRKFLIQELIEHKIITKDTVLTEIGSHTTHETLRLRAKSATEKIELEEFARVLLSINKKRGYRSSRKASTEEEGQAIDGMGIARELYDRDLTPGEYVLELLKEDRKYIPDFYRSDLKQEFDRIWETQKTHYKSILTDELYNNLEGKNKSQSWAICKEPFNIVGIKLTGSKKEKDLQQYQFRVDGLSKKLDLEHLAIVLQDINNDLNSSSGYLGAISDRSKELYFGKLTVGEYLYKQIEENPHTSLKNQVFYRQDYMDEFEKIWTIQAKFHNVLSNDLKTKIRDIVIFYQRRLKSQKGLLDFCQFESSTIEVKDKETGKTRKQKIGRRVVSKSTPLFQEVKTWQVLNNLEFNSKETSDIIKIDEIDNEVRLEIFEELNLRGDLSQRAVLSIIAKHKIIDKVSNWECNYETIEGNRTNQALYNVYHKIAEMHDYGIDWTKNSAKEIKAEIATIFKDLGIDETILDFDGSPDNEKYEEQASFRLWHLLYSSEEDYKVSKEDQLIYGNSDVNLKKNLEKCFGFKPEHTKLLANISLQQDYGNLSTKALRNILPELQNGLIYDEACEAAGYNHSGSLTKEELEKRILKDKLDLVQKNSLRNPVVEKILNQMVNLINQIIDEYGKPDEVRIELARDLKSSAKERADKTRGINSATRENAEIRSIITKDFGIPNPTRNDVIRYKLYEELKGNGYKTLFTNRPISKGDIFSKNIDIEHIIPKALLFDDSFSNKTLAYRDINQEKDKRTAMDFIAETNHTDVETYIARVEDLVKSESISHAKGRKLLAKESELNEKFGGFIERDLRNTQYIAKQAKNMLLEVFKDVVSTSGSITDKLREDWDLINMMKELNFDKYKALGLTEFEERLDKGTGKTFKYEVIKDWSKRNDHRHHAMDALTVAFTTHNHIQYINNLNARENPKAKNHPIIKNIENKITETTSGNRRFIPPMDKFRQEAKKHIEEILISIKAKNKVVTRNVNITKRKNGYKRTVQLTPRGQLHNETIYGRIKRPMDKAVKINMRFNLERANTVVNPTLRELILNHLSKYENNNKVAFSSKNLKSDPILYKGKELTEVLCFEEIYTIRKEINPTNFKDQKSLLKIIDPVVRDIMSKRLAEHDQNAREAFSNLEEAPIWLNEAKEVAIKRVTITGIRNAEALHAKKDHLGKEILDEENNKQATSFVSTSNNHHVAIYRDEKGNLQESVISFYETVARANLGLPIVDREFNKDKGWEFVFTLKINEMFVFPNDDFDVKEIDFLDQKNTAIISPHLFRVQTISTKDYRFRHHLETVVTNDLDFTYRRIRAPKNLEGIIKVRLNHLGKIVQVGEY